jgi:predicted DNA-binding transcriptional regulator YafY
VRADRLVAILLLLQRRSQVTAREVAAELEISERTARRDLEALGVAGLAVYPVRGRGGGWRLLGGGRTDLSGLSESEVRALFLVAGPAAMSPEVKAALRKLVRALPEPFRAPAEAATSAVMVDPEGWDRPARSRPAPPHLEPLQRAVIDGQQVVLGYVARDRAQTQRSVSPLGLVAKGSSWYLVAGTDAGLRTFRVDRVTSVELSGQPAVRPEGFDLAASWSEITTEVDRLRAPVGARAVADLWAVPMLRGRLGTRFGLGPRRPDGRVEVELRGHYVDSLAAELAGFGAAVEVLDPPELRQRLADLAGELAALYSADSPDSSPR